MVMAQQHRMNGWQFFQGNSSRANPFRTSALLRSGIFTPDRIGQEIIGANLNQNGSMPYKPDLPVIQAGIRTFLRNRTLAFSGLLWCVFCGPAIAFTL